MKINEFPYTQNSMDLFDHFAQLPYAIFLDSCFLHHTRGRYDIMSADPETVITLASTDLSDNPFQLIQTELNHLKKTVPSTSHDLPFTIGALGYLGYDTHRRLEKIPNSAINDISLPESVIGIYHWSIVVDHYAQKSYYITAYDENHSKTKRVENLLATKNKKNRSFKLTQPFSSNMSKSFYAHQFDQIKKHIIAGDCYQINFAQRFSAIFEGSPWIAYQQLREKNPAPFSAFMQFDHHAILSTSPERFLKVTDRLVETKPIKGTMPRFLDSIHDQQSADSLLNSEKDRAENLMIVDLLRNDLSRVCEPGSVQVPRLFALESFSNVHHLVSTITGKLSHQYDAIDLFKHCFPGGSITGAPKIRAMEIIESLEPHRRSVYCGSIFYADINGNFGSNIAIRTLICDHQNIHCYAGGGIVFDSECEQEYAETWVKVEKMMRALECIFD